VDEILHQHSEYAVSMIDKERDRFVNFDPVKSRLDILMHETVAGRDMYSKLWNVDRMLLNLSHGQAAVEIGFSINKLAEEVHLQAETFVAKRIICDHMRYVCGIDQVDVAYRELLLAPSSDRNTTCTWKNQRKQLKLIVQSDKKRKAVSDHIEELKKKKARLQPGISSLEASADTLLTNVETKHAIKYVTETNSLHHTVKEQ